MKISILCPFFWTFDGISRVAKSQARELATQGHTVKIFTLSANMEPPEGTDLNVLGMPRNFLAERLYRLLFPLDFVKAMKWLPKLKDSDVVYCHLYPMTWLGYLAKRFHGIRYVYYSHHLNPPNSFPTFVERTYMRLRLFPERWIIKRADAAISISQYCRQQLLEDTGMDSEVVYNNIDQTRFHRGIDGTPIRVKHELGDDPVMLFVGHVSPNKRIDLLIQAYNTVKTNIPNARLVVVGKQFYKEYARKLIEMCDDSVIFAGDVTDEELPLYYAACDVYTTASIWEGFNLPLVEAQACGKPVVAFDIGPHPEVVKDQEAGLLVPSKDIAALAQGVIAFLNKSRDGEIHSN